MERYARDGTIDRRLAFYADYLDPQQLAQLRTILLTPVKVTPVAIAQFLYSPQGEIILERVGEIIQTKAGQSGFFAIRAALIKAATAPEGLTLLGVLQEFPTAGIRINSALGFEIIDELSLLIQQTGTAIAAVEAEALREVAIAPPPPVSALPDLRQPGPARYSKQAFTLNDSRRQRTYPVDLYLPTSPPPLGELPLSSFLTDLVLTAKPLPIWRGISRLTDSPWQCPSIQVVMPNKCRR